MKRVAIAVGLAAILLGTGWVLAPVYQFFAEGNAALRGPFGWVEIPEEAPYTEGSVAPGYDAGAAAAREILAAHRAEIGAPALSAAVVRKGKLIWAGAVGYANIAAERPATPETLFRIGSTSKAVTGTLFARMADAGEVALDAPLADYLGTIANPDWSMVTLRQLASHTGGIANYERNGDLWGTWRALNPVLAHGDVAEGLEYFDGSGLLFEPGTDFEYSSYGTNLLSVALQDAGGAPFQELIADRVRAPLGLSTPLPGGDHPDKAVFYQLREDGALRIWPRVDLSHKLAGGGFMARPADLAIMGAAWLDPAFITEETRAVFWTPQVLRDGTVNEQGYALNWRWADRLGWAEEGEMLYGNANHGGVSKGAMAWLVVVPELDLALAMAINTRVWPFGNWAAVQTDLIEVFRSDPQSL